MSLGGCEVTSGRAKVMESMAATESQCQALAEWRQQKFLSPNYPNRATPAPPAGIPAPRDRKEQPSHAVLAGKLQHLQPVKSLSAPTLRPPAPYHALERAYQKPIAAPLEVPTHSLHLPEGRPTELRKLQPVQEGRCLR